MKEKYNDKGLEIYGFPCNQFMGQEPRSEKDLKEYLQKAFKVNFKLFKKIKVNGENTHPVYVFLRRYSKLYNSDKKLSK